MNTKKMYAMFAVASLSVVAASAVLVLPASAAAVGTSANTTAAVSATAVDPNLPTSISVGTSAKFNTAAQKKAVAAINARITALNALQTRISQMAKVSASEKATLDVTIQTSLAAMSSLQTKIQADTTNATLKTDIQSITKAYRIYVLVVPQGRIVAESDRVMTIVGLMQTLSITLQTRITAAQAAGQNVATLSASLSDMNAKVADANVQAQAAVSLVAGLQPDNGNTTVFQSNEVALKAARADLTKAAADLKAARQDAGSIVKALEAVKPTVTEKTSTGAAAAVQK